MKKISWLLLSSLLILAVAVPVSAQALKIGGTYSVHGVNPDGSEYTGSVVIKESNGSYQFTWSVGGSTFQGTGTLEDDVLTVEWGQPDPVIYVVIDGGKQLEGSWAGGEATETLIKK
jgi:hypothetical protein